MFNGRSRPDPRRACGAAERADGIAPAAWHRHAAGHASAAIDVHRDDVVPVKFFEGLPPFPSTTALETRRSPLGECAHAHAGNAFATGRNRRKNSAASSSSSRGLAAARAAGIDCWVISTPLTEGADFSGAARRMASVTEVASLLLPVDARSGTG